MSKKVEIKNGITTKVRTGRLGRDGIEWSSPFTATLSVDTDGRGRLCGLSLKGVSFAEFDPRHHEEAENLFVAENYALELLPE
ncbi:TPA: hypothetical protein ACNVX4_005938 [Pseudomonas aeruginosa]|uniref:hypothetical protein n=1 Tax=Pseudomonas aeruginosa TaxID=287 RepID=UPI002556468A|nr:hypothetical protein [Pseudomonas aeruginosa]MDS9918385.1 hypothetical protein [Pseudomonas aeruginosa]HBO1619894.1 hypothetical protein [Pseudomonas aeruginosa]HBO9386124.1 hypothetical protein [Pseudomonas aeruginosa]HCF2940938.1 hypothetical protein [Pseudomonas aeruginosa]